MLMVHYMAWYQAKPKRDYWGWHWTMDHFNPDQVDSSGRRSIASHYYPLTGPYDSNDEHILEYQVLLMKLSGIDGVIADWYGIEDFFDYAAINESTHLLARYAHKAGLSFCLAYEDQSIKHMVNNDHLVEDQAIAHGQEVMRYVEAEWFDDEAYLKLAGRPVLLNFGPQHFFQNADWDSLFAVLETRPHFFTLDNRLAPVATGAFPWPPMWKATDSVLGQGALDEFLDSFYRRASDWDFALGGAFPGFRDIYGEAGLGFTYGFLDGNNGGTFAATLEKALASEVDIVQLITWNDYGEGTNIEPTREYGYQYLEQIQRTRKAAIDPSFAPIAADLSIPLRLFELRGEHAGDAAINDRLDGAFDFIVSGDLASAKAVVESLSASTGVDLNDSAPGGYSLAQNYPNPFNPQTQIGYSLGRPEKVELSVYNAAGQLVQRLVDANQGAGGHRVVWDASGLVSGLYFYKIRAGDYSAVKKCVVLQ
ncbi:MAG: T9SS type A sorting domain-containing protein [Candidatus Latescibacteria bacterium]|nr:T9SS type A sorting domain-containing protein [Candidatus Latescibacterota bacterium]